MKAWSRTWDGSLLTWDNVPGVHGILVLDETEAIHELDLGDLASAVRGEVRLDIGLGSWVPLASTSPGSCWQGRVSQATHHSGADCPGRGGSTTPRSLCLR
jgi:hypothetical protein